MAGKCKNHINRTDIYYFTIKRKIIGCWDVMGKEEK
jgi:hypothetical protein